MISWNQNKWVRGLLLVMTEAERIKGQARPGLWEAASFTGETQEGDWQEGWTG